jgi:hypothetical protein
MNNPFQSDKPQASLPYDNENNAFRLRDNEWQNLVDALHFVEWLRLFLFEAKKYEMTPYGFFKLLKNAYVNCKCTQYALFQKHLTQAEWLLFPEVEIKNGPNGTYETLT